MTGKVLVKAREYLAAASPLVAYGVLVMFWGAVLQQFWGAMRPRFAHFGLAGLKISDRPCGCPLCDFSAFWPAGQLVRAGQVARIYDTAAFLAYRHAVFSPHTELLRWFYPPPALLPVAAISYLPFETGFWVWTAALTVATVLLLRWAGVSWVVVGVSMVSPAALWNAELGQFGTVSGGLAVASALLADAAPVWAGVVLGFLAIKPQAGLMAGVGMLGRRRYWPGLAAAVLVVAGLCVGVTMVAGVGVWGIYFSEGSKVSRAVLEALYPAAGYEKFGISVFWALRVAGAGLGAAYAIQGVALAASGLLVWTVWRSRGFLPRERMAVTVFCSLLATPYGYTDDMVGYSVALAVLAAARGWRIDLVDVFLWLWPAFCPIVFMRTGLLFTPLVLGVALGRVWWGVRARRVTNAGWARA